MIFRSAENLVARCRNRGGCVRLLRYLFSIAKRGGWVAV